MSMQTYYDIQAVIEAHNEESQCAADSIVVGVGKLRELQAMVRALGLYPVEEQALRETPPTVCGLEVLVTYDSGFYGVMIPCVRGVKE